MNRSNPDIDRVADSLRRESRRMTGPRQAVLAVLRRESKPLSTKEIFSRLRMGECDLATVYRSVRMLEDIGVVKGFQFGDGVVRYQFFESGVNMHKHHLICTRCTSVLEIEECGVCEIEERVASRNGFKAVTHRLEFFGLCPACQ